MDVTLHVASLSGDTLLRVQRGHFGEQATVAQLEKHLGLTPRLTEEGEEEVTFMSAGEILEDESLLVHLPCEREDLTIEIQRVVQKSLKFCLQIRNDDFDALLNFLMGTHSLASLANTFPRQIERYIPRKVAAKITVGELKALLFLKHERPCSQVNYDLTSGGVALVETDELKDIWSLRDIEEVHLGLAATRRINFFIVQGVVPLGAAAVQPIHQVQVQHPQAAAMFQQPLPQFVAHQAHGMTAVQPYAQVVPQHPQGPALRPRFQAAHMNAAHPSRAELQTLMQQRLASSLQRDRLVYFQ